MALAMPGRAARMHIEQSSSLNHICLSVVASRVAIGATGAEQRVARCVTRCVFGSLRAVWEFLSRASLLPR